MDVDDAIIRHVFALQNARQVLAGECLEWVFEEGEQQRVTRNAQRGGRLADMRQFAGSRVQRPVAKVEATQFVARRLRYPLGTAQEAAYPGEQFAHVARLGKEIVGTDFDTYDPLDFIGSCRMDENRDIRRLAQLA